jgi:hypothetical protein
VFDVPSLTAEAGAAETASATTAARMVTTRIMVEPPWELASQTREEGAVFPRARHEKLETTMGYVQANRALSALDGG